jgi:hypothetical protein
LNAPWLALRTRIDESIHAEAPRLFELLRDDSPALERFASADHLLSYLAKDLRAELDAKDGIYSRLVVSARAHGPASSLSYSLLWVGLWPGLTAAFHRRLWYWQDAPDELVSEISSAFTRLIIRINFARVRRVVSTLVRSTERDVIGASLARTRWRSRFVAVGDIERLKPTDVPSDAEASASFLEADLRQVIGKYEGEPVAHALALGYGGATYLAKALGLTPGTARQRLCRARKRLRVVLARTGASAFLDAR